MMTAFKTLVTLILLSVIGLALLVGPPAAGGGLDDLGPTAPGAPAGGPATVVVLLILIGVPLLGIGRRLTGNGG
jgi:hypothetical protein